MAVSKALFRGSLPPTATHSHGSLGPMLKPAQLANTAVLQNPLTGESSRKPWLLLWATDHNQPQEINK